jgi:hypothetical protein
VFFMRMTERMEESEKYLYLRNCNVSSQSHSNELVTTILTRDEVLRMCVVRKLSENC